MRCVLIDDEPKSREVLRELISLFVPDLEIIGEAGNIRDSVSLIQREAPDLVFFDILLQEGDSFEIIKQLDEVNFEMIFVTAFDEDSVRALKFSGAKVLLKPIQINELIAAVAQVQKQTGDSYQTYKMAKGLLKGKLNKIPVATSDGLKFLPLTDVLYIKREEQGCSIHFKNKLQTSTEKTLEDFRSFIDSDSFQLYDGYLVNGLEVSNVNRELKELKLHNGSRISYAG